MILSIRLPVLRCHTRGRRGAASRPDPCLVDTSIRYRARLVRPYALAAEHVSRQQRRAPTLERIDSSASTTPWSPGWIMSQDTGAGGDPQRRDGPSAAWRRARGDRPCYDRRTAKRCPRARCAPTRAMSDPLMARGGGDTPSPSCGPAGLRHGGEGRMEHGAATARGASGGAGGATLPRARNARGRTACR